MTTRAVLRSRAVTGMKIGFLGGDSCSGPHQHATGRPVMGGGKSMDGSIICGAWPPSRGDASRRTAVCSAPAHSISPVPVAKREPDEFLERFSDLSRCLRALAGRTYAAFEVGSAQAKFLRHIGRSSRISQADLARR